MATAEQITERLVDQAATADDNVESKTSAWVDRTKDLMGDPGERNLGIWLACADAADLDESVVDLVSLDLEAVPPTARDAVWRDTYATLVAASRLQAFIEILALDAVKMAHANAEEMPTLTDDFEALREAARVGVSKSAVEARRQQRRALREEMN